MNNRLQQFLAAENISQAQFADAIDVARASVSHVLAGRNKPGYDFIKSISEHYPKLSLEWLINGKGKMYKESSTPVTLPAQPAPGYSDEIFGPEEPEIPVQSAENKPVSTPLIENNTLNTAIQTSVNQKNIVKVVVFYDDNTYQELK